MGVNAWLPPQFMEDELIAPVVEAELAGLRVLEPELVKGYDEGLSATSRMSSAVAAVLTKGLVSRVWTSAGERSSAAADAHWRREARRAGIFDRLDSPRLPEVELERWRRDNEERYFLLRERVKRETDLRIRLDRSRGRRPETIAADFALNGLPTHNGRMRGRALVISSDQLHTLAGLIAQHQQEDAGIGRFRWRTQGDSRVRAHHRAWGRRLAGFSWVAGAGGVLPGEETACRCWAEGIV